MEAKYTLVNLKNNKDKDEILAAAENVVAMIIRSDIVGCVSPNAVDVTTAIFMMIIVTQVAILQSSVAVALAHAFHFVGQVTRASRKTVTYTVSCF